MTKTRSSARISSAIASRSASRTVSSTASPLITGSAATVSTAAATAGADGVAAGAATSATGAAAGAAIATASALSPSSSNTAINEFTFTPSVPAAIRILPMVPSSSASTSIVALSVSISAITSPLRTSAPSATSHLASVPSSIVGDRAGIRISIAMDQPSIPALRPPTGIRISVKSSDGSGSGLVCANSVARSTIAFTSASMPFSVSSVTFCLCSTSRS